MAVRDDDCTRWFVRHQWVREHGTPRVTTIAGPPETGREAWLEWLRISGRAGERRSLFAQPARSSAAWLDRTAPRAVARAVEEPRAPVAIAVDAAALARWLESRDDRVGAFIGEGVVAVRAARRRTPTTARSLAELTLHEALEATPATAGRFELNQPVSFVFGSRSAEIDLLSRADDIAIEIDGYHHFGDADCYRRDRRKDFLLQAHGYTVLRFLADDVLAAPRDAVQTVVELLGRRRARP